MQNSTTPHRAWPVRVVMFLWNTLVWTVRVIILLVVLGLLLGLLFGKKSAPALEDNLALVIAPTGALVEHVEVDPAERLMEQINQEPPSQTSLADLIEALDKGAADSHIRLAVLSLDELHDAGMAQAEELAAAVRRFKAKGKAVHAYGEHYSQAAYLVAADATSISVDPLGAVGIEGLAYYQPYFKDALDKLGVNVNVFRVGEYKSAVEPFLRNDMSPEAREANSVWMGELWSQYLQQTGTARKLQPTVIANHIERLPELAEQAGGDFAKIDKEAGLVTHVETRREFRERMAKLVQWDDDVGSFRQIHHTEFLAHTRSIADKLSQQSKVAIVHVEGDIVDGDGEPGQAGGRTIADLLQEAEDDEQVKAVVLRVNSPGGSVFASEQIRRAVLGIKSAGKPVVASFSSVAASGGYWVSMDADRIVAHPSTVTGSIGIFGLIPTFEGPLAKLGVHTDGLATTSIAGAFDLTRPMAEPAKRVVQAAIEKGYRDFIGGVAAGRKLPLEKVDSIARGRVWSGQHAKDLGLVDEFGGMQTAVAAAAKLAKLAPDSYTTEAIEPTPTGPWQALSQLLGSAKIMMTEGSLQGQLKALREGRVARQALGWMNDPRGAYARCACEQIGRL